MVTEADWHGWKTADFLCYTQHILEVFGPHRVMFGSDWPVCLVAAPYREAVELVGQAIEQLPTPEKELIWHKNAMDFYRL